MYNMGFLFEIEIWKAFQKYGGSILEINDLKTKTKNSFCQSWKGGHP